MKFQPFDKLALKIALAIVVLATPPATAQDAGDAPKERTVIKATQYIDVEEARPVLELLPVHFALKPDQDLIVLRGESYAVENAIKVIGALDKARPSINLRVFVLSASKQGPSDVPEALEATVSQLKGVFGYTGFELLDSITLQVLEGRRGRADGGIRLGEDNGRTGYHFGFDKVTLVPAEGVRQRDIRIKKLRFEVNGHAEGTLRASLMTDVQIREGQKAVIGSSTPQGVGDTLVLIIEATAPPDPSWQDE